MYFILFNPISFRDTSQEPKTFVASAAILEVILVNEAMASGNTFSLKEEIGNSNSSIAANSERDLLIAVKKGDLAAIRDLIFDGADVNVIDKDGYSALQLVVLNGNDGIAYLLLKDKNLNINYMKKYVDNEMPGTRSDIVEGKILYCGTALHFAVFKNDKDIVDRLIEIGAESNLQDTFGRTPLEIAILRDNDSMVQLLISKGESLYIKSILGDSFPVLYLIS